MWTMHSKTVQGILGPSRACTHLRLELPDLAAERVALLPQAERLALQARPAGLQVRRAPGRLLPLLRAAERGKEDSEAKLTT